MMDISQYQGSIDLSTDIPPFELADKMEDSDFSERKDFNYYQYIICSPIIFIIGLSFFIFILTKKELRAIPTSWLVLNILSAVIIHGALLLPMFTVTYYGGWKMGVFGCHFSTVLLCINHMHIHVGLLLLMIDRFISFADMKKHAERMRAKVVRILILSSVAIEIAVCIPAIYLLARPYVKHVQNQEICLIESTNPVQGLIKILLTSTLPVTVNVLLGIITMVFAIAKRHRLTSDDREERARNWQAVALILCIGFLNAALTLPWDLDFLFGFSDHWMLLIFLDSLFYLLIPIPIMVLIPEVRVAMGSCCRHEKKGENEPLVKPM